MGKQFRSDREIEREDSTLLSRILLDRAAALIGRRRSQHQTAWLLFKARCVPPLFSRAKTRAKTILVLWSPAPSRKRPRFRL